MANMVLLVTKMTVPLIFFDDDIGEEIALEESPIEAVVEPVIEEPVVEEVVVEKKDFKATPRNVPVKNYPSPKTKKKKKK